MATVAHWTERSIDDFVFKISSDFAFQLVKKMDAESLNRKKISERLGVSVGRVSQVLNNPGNLTLRNCVQYARVLGMKAALVAYDDGDPNNDRGPVNSEIFCRCWQKAGSPRDFFELAEASAVRNLPTALLPRYVFTFAEHESEETNTFLPGVEIEGLGVSATSTAGVRINA